MRKFSLILTAVLVAMPLCAVPITVDGSWNTFLHQGVGSFAVGCALICVPTTNPGSIQLGAPPWTFSGPAIVTVLDLFRGAERFELFNNGFSVGVTSGGTLADLFPTPCGGNIACALANTQNYDRGVFTLGNGSHSLTIRVNAVGASGEGVAAFQVSPGRDPNEVPEPSTLLLLCGPLTLAIAMRKRA